MAKKAQKRGPKKPQVTLSSGGQERTFELSHALRILQMKKSAWSCVDKEFEFVDNDLKRKPKQGSDKESKTED